jgi:hypothetical protein
MVEWPLVLRHGGNARPARGHAAALGLDEGAQDRQRQIAMVGLDRLIEPVRQFAFARERAVPFAFVVGEAADLPPRQLKFDQRQRRIGPGGRLDQPLDPRSLFDLSSGRKAAAGLFDHLGHEACRQRGRIPEPAAEIGLILLRKQGHDVTLQHGLTSRVIKVVKTPFENEVEE